MSLTPIAVDVSVRGRILYLTNRGHRIAAIVPIPLAEEVEQQNPATG